MHKKAELPANIMLIKNTQTKVVNDVIEKGSYGNLKDVRVVWPAVQVLSCQHVLVCETWIHESSQCQWARSNSQTHKTSAAQTQTSPVSLHTYSFKLKWETRHTNLALIGGLCHELCNGCKGIMKLIVGSLKMQQKTDIKTQQRHKHLK